jgi:phosphoserine phosphatase RsbU/P
VGRAVSRRHLLPLGVLGFCGVLNLVSEPGQVVVGVFAMAPLVAAIVLGRRATAVYAVAAVVLAGRAGQPVAQLCDALLAGMAGRVPDDIAVLAVRIA